MPEKISVFRSPAGEAQYMAAYEAVLDEWPVPYEELYIPTRFGDTHVIASGSKDAPPLVLLHPAGGGAVIWVRKIVLISPAATFVPIPAWAWHFIPANMIGPLIGSKRVLLDAYEWIWQDFPKDECMASLRATTAITGRPHHWSPTVFSDEELHTIRTPVLLLIGDHEVIYKPEDAIRRATRQVAGLIAEIIPNANHIAEFTASEVVNHLILDFLAEPVPAGEMKANGLSNKS